MQTLTLEQLRATSGAGGVAGVTVRAEGGSFIVQIATRSGGSAILSKARSHEPRHFGTPTQAMVLLRGIGIAVGTFDVTHWNPDGKGQNRPRPDRSEALKRAHEAAAHDRWFRDQVSQALAEADDPTTTWVSHDAVQDDLRHHREAIMALGRERTE